MSSASTAGRKCYGQLCPMATALDVVGDRWTLLILRELLGGPARFHEIEQGLPGIARNLLTSRLRRLEEDGIARRVSSDTTVLYALTDQGAAIRATLEELGFWGASLRRVGPVEHDRSIRAMAMALQSVLVRAGDSLPDQRYLVELDIEGAFIEIVLGPDPAAIARPSTDADARIQVTSEVVSDLLLGRPIDDRRFVQTAGDPAARGALLRALSTMANA